MEKRAVAVGELPRDASVVIIGAGIVGLAIALELTRRYPSLSVVVLDKEATVAAHQTSHNSGVIHSGIYYKPGSLKARLCVEGSNALLRFCECNDIPVQICGKVIVATEEREFSRLEELFRRGQGNGLKGIRLLTPEQITELEPHATGLRGIHVPSTAIVDYQQVAESYAAHVKDAGGSVCLECRVVGLRHQQKSTLVETTRGQISAGLIINCAGLQSDRVGKMIDPARRVAIIPFRGEYYQIAPNKRMLVRGLIYPVPDPAFPFLGVHYTRRINGEVEAGPNAVLAWRREGYTRTSFALRDVLDYLTFPGFWRMAAKHWRMSLGEYHRSWSKRAFTRALQRLVPELEEKDLMPGGSGVRAQALDSSGKLLDDFEISFGDGIVHVRNVPSPAATASLAIARHIVDSLSEYLKENRSVLGKG